IACANRPTKNKRITKRLTSITFLSLTTMVGHERRRTNFFKTNLNFFAASLSRIRWAKGLDRKISFVAKEKHPHPRLKKANGAGKNNDNLAKL
ncbi:MAG: hypothetical protein EAY75_08885, partial [Bacteroidetes bacterium]